MKGVTVSSGFRDLTIPCENFSLPPTTFQPPPPSYPQLYDTSALALLSLKTNRFIGLTTYRYRVRFRGLKVSIRFRFRFSKYFFYCRILVLLVFLYSMLKRSLG